MKVVVPINGKVITLSFGDFEDDIDVDELTKIDYTNLFGEAVTVSALLNRIGILKAEVEAITSYKQLDFDIYTANLKKKYRREANNNGGKFTIVDEHGTNFIKLTEDSLNEVILLDLACQNKKKALIEAKKSLQDMESLYWAISSKDKKLNMFMKQVTPEEFYNEIFEGSINGILIKKPIDNWNDMKNSK